MLKQLKKLTLLVLAALSLTGTAQAQISTPAPSPGATVMQKVGLTDITVTYSRPSAKGRKVFGEVVPFGKMWRTGANAPTKISFSDSATVGGKKIAGGDYALYTIPGQAEWTIILGKNTSVQAGDYKDDMEAARFTVKPTAMSNMTETFTINFTDLTTNSANLELLWENTSVKFKIETEVDRKVMAAIKNNLDNTWPYYQAGAYYYETGRDLKQALEWVSKETDKNPRFFTLHMKAKIQAKMGDCKGAAETAQKSITLAKEAKNDEYVKMNEKLIAECKGGKK